MEFPQNDTMLVTERVLDNFSQDKVYFISCSKTSKRKFLYGEMASTTSSKQFTLLKHCKRLFVSTFLPVGFPNSVRSEYLAYQIWDSVQGICSYLRSVLCTKSLLIGAGVGSDQANALAAAVMWVSRDGIGMLGSLVLAYSCCDWFEVYVREYRLLADVLNNCGLTLDLVSAYFSHGGYFFILALSTLCKSSCGLIAGATKARISAHFAHTGHLADVTAKESTQETGVALVGILLGLILAHLIGDNAQLTWLVFIALSVLHQWANYQLVNVLVFDTLNPQRVYLLVKAIGRNSTSVSQSLSPQGIATQESLLTPLWLAAHGPRIGVSLNVLLQSLSAAYDDNNSNSSSIIFWTRMQSLWQESQFLLGFQEDGRVIVCLEENITEDNLIMASFVAFYIMDASHSVPGSDRHRLHQLYTLLLGDVTNIQPVNKNNSLAARAMSWYLDVAIKSITVSGWILAGNSIRLGEGRWRYSRQAGETSGTHKKAR